MTDLELLWMRIRICKEKGEGRCGAHCPLFPLSEGGSCRQGVLSRRGEAAKIITDYNTACLEGIKEREKQT